MKKRIFVRGLMVLVIALGLGLSAAAEVTPGCRDGEVILIDEPESLTGGLTAFRDDAAIALSALDWEDGVHGKALRLNGQSDYLEYRDLPFGPFTAAAWVNWQGSLTDDKNGEIGQRLFTVYRDEENYFSVCLRAFRDNIRETENGTVYRIDGVYTEYSLSGATGRHVEDFNPVTGDTDYAIPQNTWTHLAVTMDNKVIRLYINGKVWFEREMNDAAGTLNGHYLHIGGSVNGAPTLNAALDDAAWFAGALSAEDIGALAHGAALDFDGASEPTVYRPTAPTEPEEAEEGALHIPFYAYIVVGAAALIFIIAIVAVNRRAEEADE